ncbi:GroES-like protein [Xylariaceae sp. AK1471]|nr:GroES-like protein [Xylariaceae sp. AK1471]
MSPTNKAAFYPSNKAPSLEVSPSPYPTIGDGELLVKVGVVAINPVDWKIQQVGTDLFPFLTYPLAGGMDIAGTVIEVGPSSSSSVNAPQRFRPGDRVLGFPFEFSSRAGGFQHYVVVPAGLAVPIPDSIPFADASVLPSGVATAAVALYQYLGLEHPTLPPRKSNGKTVFIPGGASVVGSNAIQLAVASGYEVITTSSPKNFAHCEALGASRVFDYHSPNLTQDLKEAFKGKQCAGGFSTVEGSNEVVFDVVGASEGSKSVACTILLGSEGVPEGIKAEMIHAYWIKDTPLCEVIFGKFLPEALASGHYKCVPKPLVVGRGLEFVQVALDKGKANSVSCQKLVVSLEGEA